jgi:flagellar basal-body rod modification protein FlgD
MAVSNVSGGSAQLLSPGSKSGIAALGQKDFIRLMTEQLKMQDPFEPVDNKDMLAQMAQFSSLAGLDGVNETLKQISEKLDAVLAARAATA